VGGDVLVRAVIVNHNTSLFSELAVRSLIRSHEADRGEIDLDVTVVDNHSSDEHLGPLRAACDELGASFELSRWPADDKLLNTHGDVLRDFVLADERADHFLFVDCDIDFEEAGAVSTMLDDLTSDEELWAVQARFRWTEENNGRDTSLDIWAGRPIDLRVGRAIDRWDDVTAFGGTIQRRCHPGATLIRNTDLFRGVAGIVGFSCAVRMSADPDHAGFLDTLGLASAAMGAHGYRYGLSRTTVHHFFMASYDDEHVAAREADARERLNRFATSPSA
jgi:hypothetical protein